MIDVIFNAREIYKRFYEITITGGKTNDSVYYNIIRIDILTKIRERIIMHGVIRTGNQISYVQRQRLKIKSLFFFFFCKDAKFTSAFMKGGESMSSTLLKILEIAATGLGIGGTILSGYVSEKQLDSKVQKAVAKALAKQNKRK